ncbi:unnamed protein product [Effrenium voratum]|nr:unnamed protein product [Effrenium voratum]
MEKSVALKLAQRCLPFFERKGVGRLTDIESVRPKSLLGLWTGAGRVDAVEVTGKGGSASFVVKTIGSHKEIDDELALVDHMSYYNEATFYEQDFAERLCASGAMCPQPLLVDRAPSGELTICMTMLPGRSFSRSPEQTRQALQWLARLHALFWGKRADEAVRQGAAERACFWDLTRRHIELKRMPQDALRYAAHGIDARLQADKMQTMCHGDPKGANIMHDEEAGIAFYDFQWFGKAPPAKDLAYFFGVAAGGLSSEDKERELLRAYHAELTPLLDRSIAKIRLAMCVCVRSDRMPCHQSFLRQQGVAAGPRVCHQRRHSRDPGEAVGDVQLCTCNGCAKSFWPVVSLAVCASC